MRLDQNVPWARSLGVGDEAVADGLFRRSAVGIAASPDHANTVISAELAANLLARMFSNFAVVTPASESGKALSKKIKSIVLSINPSAKFTSEKVTDCWLSIGADTEGLQGEVLRIDSSSWMVYFSRSRMRIENRVFNPLSACVAACLGVSEGFKTIFKNRLPDAELAGNFHLNLLDYSVNETVSSDPFPSKSEIGESHLVGAGAIGNGFVYALSKVPNISGTLHVIENRKKLTSGHLKRYILTDKQKMRLSKLEVCRQALSHHKALTVKPYLGSFNEYAAREKADCMFDLVISAVDSGQARKDIQAKLPRLILNGWTFAAQVGVTKHDFISKDACLTCLYLDKVEDTSEDKVIGESLGLDYMQVAEMRRKNMTLTGSQLTFVGRRFGLTVDELEELKNMSIDAVYRALVCSREPMKVENQEFFVPAAYLSALSGVILAVELLKEQNAELKPKSKHLPYFRLYTLQEMTPPARPQEKDPNCTCNDEDYKSAFIEKWQ